MYFQLLFDKMQQNQARIIASMQADLIKYSNRPDAKQQVIDVKSDLITQLHDHYEYFNNYADEAAADFNQANRDGYKAGYKAAQKKYEPERYYNNGLDPDTRRAASILYAQNSQPNIY